MCSLLHSKALRARNLFPSSNFHPVLSQSFSVYLKSNATTPSLWTTRPRNFAYPDVKGGSTLLLHSSHPPAEVHSLRLHSLSSPVRRILNSPIVSPLASISVNYPNSIVVLSMSTPITAGSTRSRLFQTIWL